MKTCEAQAMDFGFFESISPVSMCLRPAEVDVQGYALCRGCTDALEVLVQFGRIVKAMSTLEKGRIDVG